MSTETTTDAPAKTAVTFDDLTKKYIALRKKVADIKARHKEELEPYTNAMDSIEKFMLGMFQRLQCESIKTPHGTPYISKRTSATVADWPAYYAWLQSKDAINDGIDHKANKTYVESYINATEEVPPGINYTVDKVVNVRAGK